MTQIKKMHRMSDGAQIYPQTHTKAVIDDNGYTAESRLQAMQDEINQKQLEVGAVPSDQYPTENSTNWVTSGGVYNALGTINENIFVGEPIDFVSITNYESFFISGTAPHNWTASSSSLPYYCRIVPISANTPYRITAADNNLTHYALLRNNEPQADVVATDWNGGSPIILPAGESVQINSGEYTYLYIRNNTGSTTSDFKYPKEIALLNPVNSTVQEMQGSLTEVVDNVGEWDGKEVILGSSIPSCGASISSDTGKWINEARYYAGLVDVKAYRNKKLVLTGGEVTSGACYTFTTAGVSLDNTPSYATGYGAPRSLTANTSVTLTVPSDAKYLYVYLQSPGVDYRPQSIAFLTSITDALEDVSSKVNTVSDTLSGEYLTISMLEQGGTNNSTGADYTESTNVRTKYLPLGEATSVDVYNNKTVDGHSLYFKFSWYDVNKEYKGYQTWTSKTSAQIPASALGGFVRIVFSRNPSATTAPSDIAEFELFLNIYGHDTLVNRVETLETKEEDGDTSATAQFVKGLAPKSITFCTWNIGHFSVGASPSSSITGSNYNTKLSQFRDLIYNTINPRVIALNEYSAVFGTDANSVSHNAKDVLFNDFAIKFEGIQNNYSCNAVFGNTYLSNIKVQKFEHLTHDAVSGGYQDDYYYIVSDLYLEGRLVKLVSTHFAFNNTLGGELQSLQIQDLVDALAQYDRVVVAGDMNLNGDSDRFNVFVNAGYTIGNSGSIVTYPSGSVQALDNIIYKGVVVSDVRAITSSLSDHYPLVCTVTV